MIYQLKGKIEDISGGIAVIDVNGVGYGAYLPERLIGSQINPGDEVKLQTVTIVSQDDIRIFGFTSNLDREFFRMLLNVHRMGPKSAMRIISSAPAATIMQLILSADKKSLSKVPGIGAKAAERLILELQEKVKKVLEREDIDEETDVFDETADVLTELGCSVSEAKRIVAKLRKELPDQNIPFDSLLSEALKLMAKEEMKV